MNCRHRTDDCVPSWSGRCYSRAVPGTRLGYQELRIGKEIETEVVVVAGHDEKTGEHYSDETF